MIKSISGGQGINISNVSLGWPYFQNYNNNPLSGQIRYDGQTQSIMVYDGMSWHPLPTSVPLVELSSDVHELLQWAKIKRDEESKIKEMAKHNSSISDAKKNLDVAKEKLDILVALSNN